MAVSHAGAAGSRKVAVERLDALCNEKNHGIMRLRETAFVSGVVRYTLKDYVLNGTLHNNCELIKFNNRICACREHWHQHLQTADHLPNAQISVAVLFSFKVVLEEEMIVKV